MWNIDEISFFKPILSRRMKDQRKKLQQTAENYMKKYMTASSHTVSANMLVDLPKFIGMHNGDT